MGANWLQFCNKRRSYLLIIDHPRSHWQIDASNMVLSNPTSLRWSAGNGSWGLCFKLSLCVLLWGEGRRRAAAWWWRRPGFRGFKVQVDGRLIPRHPDALPLVLFRRQTFHVLIPERWRGREEKDGCKKQEKNRESFRQCLSRLSQQRHPQC